MDNGSSDSTSRTSQAQQKSVVVPDNIKKELYSRVESFYGPSSFDKLKGASVVVVGLGGVGSHAAHMLVRSGISSIRLIDFDQVSLSSLNRHALASMSDVGTPKVLAMKNKLLEIIPWCSIEAVNEMFTEEHADRLLGGNPTYVIDAIDDVTTKAQLIAYCVKHNLPVITSMGAGGRADPTKLRIGSLSDCVKDPLAAKMKWKLKKEHGVDCDTVSCIFSVEKSVVSLLPLSDEQAADPAAFGCVDNFRIRVIPVLGTSPAIFGQALAATVLCRLCNFPMDAESTESTSKNFLHKMKQLLDANEMRVHGTRDAVNLDDADLEFIVRQVWGNRCALTQNRLGSHHPFTLARWNPDLPPTVDNVILITSGELIKLERWRQQQQVKAGTAVAATVSASAAKREARRAENERKKEHKKELKKEQKKNSTTDRNDKDNGADKDIDKNSERKVDGKGEGVAVDSDADGDMSAAAAVTLKEKEWTPWELKPEDAARIETRLLWARAVSANMLADLYRHPLSLEEQVLMTQWFPANVPDTEVETNQKQKQKQKKDEGAVISPSYLPVILTASAVSFILGLTVSKYLSQK